MIPAPGIEKSVLATPGGDLPSVNGTVRQGQFIADETTRRDYAITTANNIFIRKTAVDMIEAFTGSELFRPPVGFNTLLAGSYGSSQPSLPAAPWSSTVAPIPWMIRVSIFTYYRPTQTSEPVLSETVSDGGRVVAINDLRPRMIMPDVTYSFDDTVDFQPEPQLEGSIRNVAYLLEKNFVVATRRELRTLYIPVDMRTVLQSYLRSARRRAEADSRVNNPIRISGAREALAELEKKIASLGSTKTDACYLEAADQNPERPASLFEFRNIRSSGRAGCRRIVRVNPDFFLPGLPRQTPQLIVIALPPGQARYRWMVELADWNRINNLLQ